jgi:hypothetical protein
MLERDPVGAETFLSGAVLAPLLRRFLRLKGGAYRNWSVITRKLLGG